MVQFFETIPPFLISWIEQQQLFWVATAPLNPEGHVNVSPKGLEGTFHVVDDKTVWYEDISGSGIETVAHLRENGRITVMFSAFEGPPRITRLFGRGKVFEFGTPEYDELLPAEKRLPGSRAIIMVDVYKVSTSCGYAVPYYTFTSHRTALLESMERREAAEREAEAEVTGDTSGTSVSASYVEISIEGSRTKSIPEKGMRAYWLEKNAESLDALPGIVQAQASAKTFRSKGVVGGKDALTPSPSSGVLGVLTDPKVLVAFGMGLIASTAYRRLVQ